MKSIFICCVLLAVMANVCCAQSVDKPRKGVTFECVSPINVFQGVGCYFIDTGGRVVKGVETVITAPFKAKFCFPKPKRYLYQPPLWIPPTLTPLFHPPVNPPVEMGVPVPISNPKLKDYRGKVA